MNWLLIVVLLVLIAYTVRGYRRGMLRVLYSLFSLVVTILFVAWTTPYISRIIKENTQIYQKIEEKCEESIREKTQTQITEETEQDADILEEYGIKLPEALENMLSDKIQEGSDDFLESSGAYTAMAEHLAQLAVDGIAFFTALIICAILLHILGGLIDVVSMIPVLKGINRILGLAAGLLQGLIMVWLFLYLVTVIQAFPVGQELLALVQESTFLTRLYQNNLVVYFVGLFL